MNTSVRFKNLEPSDALKSYVREKLDRMEKYFNGPAEASVVLSIEKFRHSAEINITGDRLAINGKEETEEIVFSHRHGCWTSWKSRLKRTSRKVGIIDPRVKAAPGNPPRCQTKSPANPGFGSDISNTNPWMWMKQSCRWISSKTASWCLPMPGQKRSTCFTARKTATSG